MHLDESFRFARACTRFPLFCHLSVEYHGPHVAQQLMSEQAFSDPIAEQYYHQGETELQSTESADAVLRKAEVCGQQDSRAAITQSAFYYLAAAHFLEHRDPSKSAYGYHHAGQQLVRLQQFMQAGRAYSGAGRVAEKAAQNTPSGPDQQSLQHLAVRSYSKANHCFAEAGELDWSETEYLHERNARITWATMQGKHPLALLAWKASSNFGTSIPRWTAWIASTIGVFSLLYEYFFRIHWLEPMANTNPSEWIPFWSGFYYSINVTSSLALVEYQPVHPLCQAVVMLNVIAGYLFLGIGIGIIGQMVKRR